MAMTEPGGAPKFAVRPAGSCPRAAGERPHTWEHGDGADLVSYGPDHDRGVSVTLGYCLHCGVALLSVGEYYSEHAEREVWLEVDGAALPGDES